jgi:hypothetical protein
MQLPKLFAPYEGRLLVRKCCERLAGLRTSLGRALYRFHTLLCVVCIRTSSAIDGPKYRAFQRLQVSRQRSPNAGDALTQAIAQGLRHGLRSPLFQKNGIANIDPKISKGARMMM